MQQMQPGNAEKGLAEKSGAQLNSCIEQTKPLTNMQPRENEAQHHCGGEETERFGFVSRLGSVHRTERSEEHTSELQSRLHLVCRLLLEKKKKKKQTSNIHL